MNWFNDLIFNSSVAHSIFIFSIVITLGILLGKLKIKGVTLGITWILFIGILLSHFGLKADPATLHFVKEFGLILFVYSIGLQVGPGFFSSFKKGGVTLNLLASIIVVLGCFTAYIIHVITGTDLVTMVGVLSGAVTNTPGLGAAQQTYLDITGSANANVALGYAVAYPLGVVGVILSLLLIKYGFKIKTDRENEKIKNEETNNESGAEKISIEVKNNAIVGKSVMELHNLIDKDFVVSRLCREDGKIEIPNSSTLLNLNDKLLIITSQLNEPSIIAFIGEKINMPFDKWKQLDSQLVLKKIIITKPNINGHRLDELKIRSRYGVNITRITRAGVDLVAAGDLELQIGDRVLVVGREDDIERLANVLGNSTKQLREPNLMGIFFGIAIGVLFGSIPFMIPGIPQPVKLGLAGGPLIVALLISRFGYKLKIISYTTQSANMMLREIGISLFLAAVGLGAGEGFVDTIINKGGYIWILYGFIITVAPILIIAIVGRYICKLNYYTLIGLIAGSSTNPPALAYCNSVSETNYPAVAYATVYPLVMFLRVLSAQIMILIAL
jgi:Predicted permease